MASNSNVEQCLRLIRELRASIGNAKRIPLRNDVAMVNPDELMRKLTRLDEILPTAIHTAQEYVTNISSIQQQAEQECDTRLRNAKQSEEQILSEAHRTADRLRQEAEQYYQEKTAAANREAANAVSFANQEAARLKADAEHQAESMVQNEDIYQRAKARAEEMLAEAKTECARIRQESYQGLDQTLENADVFLSTMITDIRQAREELNRQR